MTHLAGRDRSQTMLQPVETARKEAKEEMGLVATR
jgi:8-oxo-dGTP pyrophosphatase MutT (NUDIX family)